MKNRQIEALRHTARKLIRELGILEIDPANTQKTPELCHALIEVAKKPGITISELGRLLLMTISTVSRLVKGMSKSGYLELKAGSDKREKSVYLTALGKEEVEKIDAFSDTKIIGALEFLSEDDVNQIISSISKYGEALEKSRKMREEIKVLTLSSSRIIRKQIVKMVADIQKEEFVIPINDETNAGILRAEEEYRYNQTFNFWYAVDGEGKVIGCIGLKKIGEKYGEVKKVFVVKEYRGKGVAQKLMDTLIKSAKKHRFETLFLGAVDKLKGAHKFYTKYGFHLIGKDELPACFEINPLDQLFFKREMAGGP